MVTLFICILAGAGTYISNDKVKQFASFQNRLVGLDIAWESVCRLVKRIRDLCLYMAHFATFRVYLLDFYCLFFEVWIWITGGRLA